VNVVLTAAITVYVNVRLGKTQIFNFFAMIFHEGSSARPWQEMWRTLLFLSSQYLVGRPFAGGKEDSGIFFQTCFQNVSTNDTQNTLSARP